MDQYRITAAGKGALISYWRRKFPYSRKYILSADDEAKLKRKFTIIYPIIMILVIGLLIGTTYVYGQIMYALYLWGHRLTNTQDTQIFGYSVWYTFCFPGFFFALPSTYFLAESIQRWALGKDYPLINDYYYAEKGYDEFKVAMQTIKIFLVVGTIVTLAVGTSALTRKRTEFSIKQFYTIRPESHSISNIQKISYYTSYQIRRKPVRPTAHYKIFVDGDSLNTLDWTFDENKSIAPFIASLHESGIRIDTVILDKLP